jgi:IS5 family transposase
MPARFGCFARSSRKRVLAKTLLELLDATLQDAGHIATSGQLVDASLIAGPRQRKTDEEKKAIKEGCIPADWKDKLAKLRQKDRDGR